MTYKILYFDNIILNGGEVKFHVVSRGSLDLNLVRRGVIQNLDDGSKFQLTPPP